MLLSKYASHCIGSGQPDQFFEQYYLLICLLKFNLIASFKLFSHHLLPFLNHNINKNFKKYMKITPLTKYPR
jgi:hypothetical protein